MIFITSIKKAFTFKVIKQFIVWYCYTTMHETAVDLTDEELTQLHHSIDPLYPLVITME